MTDFVLLRLDGEFQPSTWLRCDSARGPSGFSQSAAEPLPAGLKVVAICAAPELALRYVAVPKLGRERFRSAIGFALEDSLCCDIDELAFVLPQTLEEGAQLVAVMRKERIAEILANLRARGIEPAALLPLPSLLPPDCVWVERSLSSFRFGSDLGGAKSTSSAGTIESAGLSDLLKLKVAQDGALPLQLLLNDGIALPKLPPHLTAEHLPEPNHYLAQRLLASASMLSLSAPVLAKASYGLSPRWRLAGALLALVLGVRVLASLNEYRSLAAREHAQAQEIATLYSALYPNGPESLDPVAMLLSKLASENAQNSGGSGGALALLRTVAPVLYTETRLAIVHLDYQSGELELSFRSPDLGTIDALRARLSTLPNLAVSLGSNIIDPNGKMLTGRIKVTRRTP
jgi:type II secretion system protein L